VNTLTCHSFLPMARNMAVLASLLAFQGATVTFSTWVLTLLARYVSGQRGGAHTQNAALLATCVRLILLLSFLKGCFVSLQGMWQAREAVPPTLNAASKRLYMAVTLKGLKAMYWAGCALTDLFDALTFFPTRMAHRMYEARYS